MMVLRTHTTSQWPNHRAHTGWTIMLTKYKSGGQVKICKKRKQNSWLLDSPLSQWWGAELLFLFLCWAWSIFWLVLLGGERGVVISFLFWQGIFWYRRRGVVVLSSVRRGVFFSGSCWAERAELWFLCGKDGNNPVPPLAAPKARVRGSAHWPTGVGDVPQWGGMRSAHQKTAP